MALVQPLRELPDPQPLPHLLLTLILLVFGESQFLEQHIRQEAGGGSPGSLLMSFCNFHIRLHLHEHLSRWLSSALPCLCLGFFGLFVTLWSTPASTFYLYSKKLSLRLFQIGRWKGCCLTSPQSTKSSDWDWHDLRSFCASLPLLWLSRLCFFLHPLLLIFSFWPHFMNLISSSSFQLAKPLSIQFTSFFTVAQRPFVKLKPDWRITQGNHYFHRILMLNEQRTEILISSCSHRQSFQHTLYKCEVIFSERQADQYVFPQLISMICWRSCSF